MLTNILAKTLKFTIELSPHDESILMFLLGVKVLTIAC
jgi:hypothetical protein